VHDPEPLQNVHLALRGLFAALGEAGDQRISGVALSGHPVRAVGDGRRHQLERLVAARV
jgi:hypothetical protein